MYFVYKITFKNGTYIGCTDNLRRRKDQHNENSRKRKSKFGRYLSDNNITLSLDDMEIIYKNEDRAEALKTERMAVLESDKNGVHLLNDNYTKECSRKGKNIGNTSKEYYVIDFFNHNVIFVNNLRQFCIKNALDYKLLQRTVKGDKYTKSGYKVFYKNEWETEPEKDKYISGKFIDDMKKVLADGNRARNSKRYEVRFPNGDVKEVYNLDHFAREHGLTSGTLHSTHIKGKPTKGYQVIRRI